MQNKKAPLEGETGEAPPVAGKASRFRGSGAIGGPARDRESLCRDGVGAAKGGGEVAGTIKIPAACAILFLHFKGFYGKITVRKFTRKRV